MPFGRFSSNSRSNTTSDDNGRHRGTSPAEQADEPDHELENYLAALAPETGPETTDTGRRFGDGQVFQVRLNLIAADQLKQLAAQRNTSPVALAQEWILQRLSWESQEAENRRRQQRRQPPPYPGR